MNLKTFPSIKKLLIASHNQGKIREFKSLLADLRVQVLGIEDLSQDLQLGLVEPEEPHDQYELNAEEKARLIAQHTNIMTVADDSGLEVDALAGELGVYSKRFFEGTDLDRNIELLRRMQGLEGEARKARFVSVLCLFDPMTGEARFFRGEVEGTLSTEMLGEHGFGFDPLFRPDGDLRTFGQMTEEEKHAHSHRAKAALQLRAFVLAHARES